jgi:peptidoglycan/xylan/chitin deacetylase (PgdA/CDA1 family)
MITPVRGADKFAVVAYHDVVDFPGDLDDDAVTVDRLIGFFEWLRANHWTTISLDDVEAARSGKKELPDNSILISFDDGYHSFYTRVYPLLLAYHIPALFAIEGSWVDAPDSGKVKYGNLTVPRTNFVTWEEMREMSKSGLVEFASHTYDLHHGGLGNPQGNEFALANSRLYTPGRGYETEAQFRKRVYDDLAKSRDLLASRLGKAPRAIVWPYGRYTGPGLEEAKRAGFTYAFTLDPEPADIHHPFNLGRFLPTNDPKVATMVSNVKFEDPLPRARRLVDLNPADFWTGDQAGTNDRLGHEIERLRTLGATGIVCDAVVVNKDGRIEAAWFPNSQIPMRADILSRLSWQSKARGQVNPYLRLPSTAALKTLGSASKVRRLFDELGAQVYSAGLVVDDAPELSRMETHATTGTLWDVRAARNAAIGHAPSERAALALSAFKTYEYERPISMLIIVGDGAPNAAPSAIADLTLVPVAPRPRDVSRLVDRMSGLGWFIPSVARRGGLWFAGTAPPKERDLIKATRIFQRNGGTALGWSVDDLMHNLPKATVVEPTVSASSYPVKF